MWQQPFSVAHAVLVSVHSLLAGCLVHAEDARADIAVLPQTGPHGYYSSSFGWGKCDEGSNCVM